MKMRIYVRWFYITCYSAILFWLWEIHVPVRNIFLFFLLFVILTCLLLILFRSFPRDERREE